MAAPALVVTPKEFGTSLLPYTTSRVNAYGDLTQYYYPFAASGRLFFQPSSTSPWTWCSASLIKPGLVVTAAHCVTNFGSNQYFMNFYYVPAYYNGTAPYGWWTAVQVRAMATYLNGTANCLLTNPPGTVCENDIAVVALNKQNGVNAGSKTGWLGFAYDRVGFNTNNPAQALITQLGYPWSLDGGTIMQRTDAQGYVSADDVNNTVIGSLMTGGSSGGPWVVNLGWAPTLSSPTQVGISAAPNLIVGVTSWGTGPNETEVNDPFKKMGASPFTSTNILALVNDQCIATPAACIQ
jgi:V8-like Glu-specific endopeptidase